MEKGNTKNLFRYFEVQKCYDYYEEYAMRLMVSMSPVNNPFYKKSIKNLSFNYLWAESIGAGSLERDKDDVLIVNEGAILKLYSLFYKLNTRLKVIPLAEEQTAHIELDASILFTNEKEPKHTITIDLVYSDNIASNNIAEYMAMFAIKFLIGHEIGHALNGHTEFYQDIRKRILSEKNDGVIKSLYLNLQALEMDADAFGICRVIDEVVSLYGDNDKICTILKNPIDIFKLVIFSVHGIFYICREMDTTTYEYKEHPPSFVRESFIIDSAKHHLIKQYGMNLGDEFFIKDVGQIEAYMNLANNVNADVAGKYIEYVKEFSEAASIHCDKIIKNYRNNVSKHIKCNARLPIEGLDY